MFVGCAPILLIGADLGKQMFLQRTKNFFSNVRFAA
jgi:hypothetical protein